MKRDFWTIRELIENAHALLARAVESLDHGVDAVLDSHFVAAMLYSAVSCFAVIACAATLYRCFQALGIEPRGLGVVPYGAVFVWAFIAVWALIMRFLI